MNKFIEPIIWIIVKLSAIVSMYFGSLVSIYGVRFIGNGANVLLQAAGVTTLVIGIAFVLMGLGLFFTTK